MLKVKIIYEPWSLPTLEEKVNEFINREEVGQIHTVQFSDHAVLIMYDECDRLEPEPFIDI